MKKHTHASTRAACASLATDPDGSVNFGNGIVVRRVTRATGCSLGNVRIVVDAGQRLCVIHGRFNEVLATLVMTLNEWSK
jgi:hypothetical protein